MSGEAQPTPGQDPAVSITGPWAEAITTDFADLPPAVQARVGQFMASRYQPYVTRLEGERGDPTAQQFYAQFQGDDQGEAFLKLAEQMFGEEALEGIVNVLLEDGNAAGEKEAPQAATLTPEQQQAIDWANSQREATTKAERQAAYEAERTDWLKANAEGINPEAFDVFVAQEGDYPAALAKYNEFAGTFKPAGEPDPPADPPPTVPSSGTAPPTTKVYTNFDEGLDDMFAEIRAGRAAPPTV